MSETALLWLVDGDYEGALIHLAWRVGDGHRIFAFGLMELFPTELPRPETMPECRYKFGVKNQGSGSSGKRRDRLCVQRFYLPLEKAIAWYTNCRAGTVTFPVDDDSGGNTVLLEHTSFTDDPPWPDVMAATSLPCVSASWGTVRTHHLWPDRLLPEIADLLTRDEPVRWISEETRDEAIRWLSQQLFFNVAEYREWLGSVHLVAPNPIFRDLHRRREVGDDGSEHSMVRLTARAGQVLDGLELALAEFGTSGLTAIHTRSVTQPDIDVTHRSVAEMVGHVITCPQRGVLDWSLPTPYVLTILARNDMSATTKIVQVPGSSGETYQVPMIDSTTHIRIGGHPPETSVVRAMQQAQRERAVRQANQTRVEKWFHGNQDEARRYVRELITGARTRVWIVDPYFATVEFFRYALAIAQTDVQVTMLIGSRPLKKKGVLRANVGAGIALHKEIKRHRAYAHFDVRIMAGATVHDRFLVIDDSVWLSGNSLNSIGARASMLVKLANPEPILAELDRIRLSKHTKTLDKWLSDNQRFQNPIKRLLQLARRQVKRFSPFAKSRSVHLWHSRRRRGHP